MSLAKKLFSQTAIYGSSSIIGRFLNYLLVPLYTAVFTTEEYGVVTEMYAYASFFIVVLTYGMETAFFRFARDAQDPAKVYSTTLGSILISSVVFVLLAIIASSSIATLIRHPEHPEFIVYFAVILATDALTSIPFARLRLENKAFKFASLRLLSIFTNILFNLFFILFCPYVLKSDGWNWLKPAIESIYNPGLGVGYVFISNVISSVILIPFMWKELGAIRFGIDKELWKSMFVYAFPLLFVGLAGMVNETLDRVILKYLLPESTAMRDLGIYGGCYKLSILMTLFIQAYRYSAEPFFFSQLKSENSGSIYAKLMNYFIVVCCLIFLTVSLYLDLFKEFLRNPEMYEGLDIVPVLLLANLFLGVHINVSIWYKLADKTKQGAWISVAGAVLTIILNLSLIPLMGYKGAAWATLICYVSMAVLNYLVGQRYYPVPYQKGRFLVYLGISLALYFLSIWLKIQLPAALYYTVSALLILAFAALAFISERKNKTVNLPA